MSNNRTNITYHRAKNDENISDEILKEYLKLKKISHMPVPEPSEIFKNPEEFKPLFNMILNPLMTAKIGTSHPYIKYFKLIADKLNFKPSNIIPEQPQLQKEQKMSEQIKSNKISNKDDDTDDEDDNLIITE
jgi:hypothetical protein